MPSDLVTRLFLKDDSYNKSIENAAKKTAWFQGYAEKAGKSVVVFAAKLTGVSYAVGAVSDVFGDAVQKSIAFEKSLSSLRSLTGLSADGMEYLKNKSIELSSASTKSANKVVDAFKLIGSQQPELLKNKVALAEVTRQAIILSEAAEMDVPDAAKALTGSINQMGESASVASEYINILSAASQAGSADIQYLSTAVEKSGGAASSVGVKYNELIASIEAIAPKITEASSAGNNLRNIFLKLESSSDKNLKPSVVGLTSALENLAEKNMDATEMTKMFGLENVTAALAITNSIDEYKRYLKEITGTNKALEQQKINNDNLAGSIDLLKNSWDNFTLVLNKSNGVLKETADFMTAIISRITRGLATEEQKVEQDTERLFEAEKKALNNTIKSWEDYGLSKKEAIEKTKKMHLSESDYSVDLKREEEKLNELIEAKNKSDQNVFKTAARNVIFGNLPSDLEREISSQRELVNELRVKNRVYAEELQYLDELSASLDKVNKKKKNANNENRTEKEIKRDIGFKTNTENVALSIRNDLIKLGKSADWNFEIASLVHVKPSFVISEETDNIEGSIADYQNRIQTTTLLYNEATTKELRLLYAKRISDLEHHLEKMTDINEGMLEMSSDLNSLIQSGVISSFEQMGEALANGDPAEAMRSMLINLMDLLKQFGSALVAAGLAKMAFDKLLFNPFAAVAAGAALIVATSAAKAALMKAVRPMAEGGIAYSPTYALIGEYAGASSNPEVVAPLNKLRDMIQPKGEGAEALEVHFVGRVSGRDLEFIQDKRARYINRTE